MQPNGANKNNEDQAIFSNAGPYLKRPDDTNKPSVIPKIYKLKNRNNKGMPRFKIEIPNKGLVISIAGTPNELIKKHGKINLEEVFLKLNRTSNEF